ncbi:unnamed protein product [Diabrotica balteata]|uniref:ABC transporter domain-containing protein n=1 Tax=Diabrotica balteata TaxID=107213 RepID=A0A9N9SPN5_DIABA|nr:unnamed protein product [Diabrotica balteata]
MHDDYAVFVDRVVKRYGQKEVLTGICMKVERGIIYGLLGASGCGKTTLLSSIVGRKKTDGGEIWVLGGKPGEVGSGVPGPRVGYMPQDIALVGEFTVKDAIYYFGRIFSMEDSLIAKRYRNLHTLLELPPDDRYLKNCSGGQQRRVSLAASLVHKPELLIMDEPTTSVATSVSTFEIGHGSTDILAKKKILKARNALNKSRMKALLDKNLKQFYRNITGIIFLMTFPILQVGVFMGAVGGDIRNIPLGIVNDEAMSVTCPGFSFNGTATATDDRACQLRNISCRFLSYLDHPMIDKVHFETLEDAKDAVLHGKIVGAMYMSSNFTSFLEERIDKGKDIEKDILSLSEIKVWMDMSNRQIGATLKYKLIDLYTKFQNSLFDDCDFVPGFGDLPVNINFIYGDGDEPYTVFMIPGSLITIMFFMGAIMTSQIIITDRHDGVWDRSIVAGVTSLEITITHLVLQASICIIQTAELLIVVYLIYQQEYLGSLWLMYLMVYLQGICGMAYGFWVSVISTDHSMANTVLTGIFLPMMMLSGLMWPTEGMPPALRIFSRCLPFTMAIESLRNVSKRGWSLDNFQVYSGMGVGFMWTVFFGVLSVYLIKKKR